MAMKKLINNPENITTELLEGFALAFPEKNQSGIRQDRLSGDPQGEKQSGYRHPWRFRS